MHTFIVYTLKFFAAVFIMFAWCILQVMAAPIVYAGKAATAVIIVGTALCCVSAACGITIGGTGNIATAVVI